MKESSDSPIENNIDILKKGLSLSEDDRLTFLKYLEYTKNFLNFSILILFQGLFDYNFDIDVFDLDEVFYTEDLKKNDYKVRFAEACPVMFLKGNKVKGQVMIIYIDIFGNEKWEVKAIKDFKKE